MKSELPHYRNLYLVAISILKCREDIAEDIVQETYIELFEKHEIPLHLYTEDALVDACRARCLKALYEMNKSPSKPLRTIKKSHGDEEGFVMDPDDYLEWVIWKNISNEEIDFKINFKINTPTEENDSIIDFIEKNRSIKKDINHVIQLRKSNRFIFEQVKHLWKTRRTKYLDSIIQNAENFKTNAYNYNYLFLDYLKVKKWNGVPHCPHCNSFKKPYEVAPRSKYGDVPSYRCSERKCDLPYSVRNGTMFSNIKIPLAVWFYLIKSFCHNGGLKLNSNYGSKLTSISQKNTYTNLNKIYQNVIVNSNDKFTIVGIKNIFYINEVDDLLRKCSEEIKIIPLISDHNKAKEVIAIDKLGHKTIFNTISLASKELNIDARRIGECIKGKRNKVGNFMLHHT